MNDYIYPIFFICILFSGFFSAAEIAVISIGKIRLKRIMKEKRRGSFFLNKLKKNQRKTLVTILIGNNFVNVSASAIAAVLAVELYGEIGVGIATGVVTFVLLIVGEIIPKSFASSYPVRFALFAAPPMYYIGLILYPVVQFFDFFAGLVSRQENKFFSEKDLHAMVEIGVEEKVLEPQEQKLIERVLKFNDVPIRDVMIPFKNFISLDAKMSIDEASKIISRHEFTRFPVYYKSKSNIIGIIRVKDILVEFSRDLEGKNLQTILMPPLKVKDSDLIDDVFRLFQKTHTHMGVVVDKKEKVVGLVTLEDLLEEIVGEFETDSLREFPGHA